MTIKIEINADELTDLIFKLSTLGRVFRSKMPASKRVYNENPSDPPVAAPPCEDIPDPLAAPSLSLTPAITPRVDFMVLADSHIAASSIDINLPEPTLLRSGRPKRGRPRSFKTAVESARVEPDPVETSQVEPSQAEPDPVETSQVEPSQAEPDPIETSSAEPEEILGIDRVIARLTDGLGEEGIQEFIDSGLTQIEEQIEAVIVAVPLTHNHARNALAEYVRLYGYPAATEDFPKLIPAPCGPARRISDLPTDQETLTLVIAAIMEATEHNSFNRPLVKRGATP